MGARNCHHAAAESDDSSSEASQSEQSSGSDSDDEKPSPSLMARITGCVLARVNVPGGMSFVKVEDLRVSQTAKAVPSKALLINNEGKSIDTVFKLDRSKCLGEGGYAVVCLATHKQTGQERAVKIIQKALIAEQARLQREIDIVMALDHPNIYKVFQTFEDRRYIYLVLELCKGGELFDRIVEEGHLSERLAAIIMQQIFRAVHYMHENGVCHRDMKPENFLFQHKAPIDGNTLKLIDFGIANTFREGHDKFSTKTGTPYYVAPEVLKDTWTRYGKEVDMWACGVIMYVLLSGRLPFKGKDEASTLQAVMRGTFSFPEEKFGQVSQEAKALIKHLLTKKVQNRCTSAQALNDTWTTRTTTRQDTMVLSQSVINNLRDFRNKHRLHKAALHAIARQLDEGQIKQIKDLFFQMDEDQGGTLTREEVMEGFKRQGVNMTEQEMASLVQSIDADGSGEIDYTEFLAATLERRQYLDEDACWTAFRIFDQNDDGRISRKELQTVLNSGQVVSAMGKSVVDEVMQEVDTDGDGYIDFNEFMAMMRK